MGELLIRAEKCSFFIDLVIESTDRNETKKIGNETYIKRIVILGIGLSKDW